MRNSHLFSSGKKNMTIHLYIQTEHICEGTVQSKLAHNATAKGGSAERRELSQGTPFHRKTGWAAAASEGGGRREVKGAAQSLGPGQDTANTADNLRNLCRADMDTTWEETLNLSTNLTY